MKITEVDNRGLACPMPVVNTKKVLDGIENGRVISIVDNQSALENVTRFARNAGYQVEVTETSGDYHIAITKGDVTEPVVEESLQGALEDIVYFVSTSSLGQGAEELGKVLMKSFLYTLRERKPAPRAMIFVNSGVWLTTEGSPVLEHLEILAGAGTGILSCGTCLDYYNLKEKLAVGRVSNMYEITEQLAGTGKVVTVS